MKHVDLFIGAICEGNPGPGGWGALLRLGPNEKSLSGHDPQTTHNRLELSAAIAALRNLIEPCVVTLHTHSRFIADGVTRYATGWTRTGWISVSASPVRNADLWHDLIGASHDHELEWNVHAGPQDQPDSDRVKQLAMHAAREITDKGE